MTMGCVQPGTKRGTFLQMIGSRKTVPPRMLRMVPLGDFHIFLRLNSSTRASSGVMVAHLTPTPYFLIASGVAVLNAEVEIFKIDVEIGKNQLVFDELPDDASHLIAVELDDRGLNFDF